MASNRTARERMAAAKSALAAIEKKIDATTEARRRSLLADDDDDVAAAIDDERAALLLRRQRCIDKIEWLPALVVAEESEAAWPSNFAATKALIDSLLRRLQALQAKPAVDRSAAEDADLGHLRQRVPALRQRLEQLSKMEAS
jgi:hypothetical protein